MQSLQSPSGVSMSSPKPLASERGYALFTIAQKSFGSLHVRTKAPRIRTHSGHITQSLDTMVFCVDARIVQNDSPNEVTRRRERRDATDDRATRARTDRLCEVRRDVVSGRVARASGGRTLLRGSRRMDRVTHVRMRLDAREEPERRASRSPTRGAALELSALSRRGVTCGAKLSWRPSSFSRRRGGPSKPSSVSSACAPSER